MNGWTPMETMLVVNWCWHRQEFVPVPKADGYRRLLPVWEAR
jgi:hypothetical protein